MMIGRSSGRQDGKGVASIQGVSSHKFWAVFLLLFVSVGLVESAAKDCFFGPPPKPEAGNPDPHHWMKQVMEQVRKNCPGRQQTTSTEQPTTNGLCPSTWIQWEGNCYKATGQALNWNQAREECVQMGGTMVVPQSESETQFLRPFIPEQSQYRERIWINCNDIQEEEQWECTEGETEVTFTEMPWFQQSGYPIEPDNFNGIEECVILNFLIDPAGKWHDTVCNREFYTVCKQPVQVVSPTMHP